MDAPLTRGSVDGVPGPEFDPDVAEFLRSTTRTVLLGTRADGSPTGWPMTGLATDVGVEFSTYRKAQKVRDFERSAAASVVVHPDADRALVLVGEVEVRHDQHVPSAGAGQARPETVASGVADGAQQRMAEGRRIVLAFTPTAVRFVGGLVPDGGPDRGPTDPVGTP